MDYLIVEEFNRFWALFAVNERLYPHRRACTLNLWISNSNRPKLYRGQKGGIKEASANQIYFSMKKKYYFYSIMTCLEKAIQYPVEFRDLQILIYGWRVKHRLPVYHFYGRNYMTEPEIRSFSRYAGYDLSQDSE